MQTKSAGIVASAAFHAAVMLVATFMPWVRVGGLQFDGFENSLTVLGVLLPNWLPFAITVVVLVDLMMRRRGIAVMDDRLPIVLGVFALLHSLFALVSNARAQGSHAGFGALLAVVLASSLTVRLVRQRAHDARAATESLGCAPHASATASKA